MVNFDRQYRFSAGKGSGFEIGETSDSQPTAIHISFSIQKTDLESQNNAKITLWNLNDEHIAILNEKDCVVTLKAGYGDSMPLVFVGNVSYVKTSDDGADVMTEIEAIDGRVEVRDTHVSISYNGTINGKKICEAVASEMGLPIEFSYNCEFGDFPNGYSYLGQAKNILNKVCDSNGLTWSIQNGIIQIKKERDVMQKEVFLLRSDTGLIGTPQKVNLSAENPEESNQIGWDVEYFMNAAINIDDYVKIESKYVSGYFRVYSVQYDGDNLEGDWKCLARLLEA